MNKDSQNEIQLKHVTIQNTHFKTPEMFRRASYRVRAEAGKSKRDDTNYRSSRNTSKPKFGLSSGVIMNAIFWEQA